MTNVVPLPTSLATVIVPPSCSTIFLRDREAEPEAAPLGRDEILEDRPSRSGRNAAAGVVHADLHAIAVPFAGDDHQAARRGRLDRVDHQVAVDAAEREHVPFDVELLGRELGCEA